MRLEKKVSLVIIISIISILFVSFLYIDLKVKPNIYSVHIYFISNTLKYISICLCFVISLLISKNCIYDFDKRFLQLGLFFTTLADLCLIILDKFLIGVIFFCVVQMCYIVRFNRGSCYNYLRNLLLLLLGILATRGILIRLSIDFEMLYAISTFYIACIITSVFSAIKAKKNNMYQAFNNYLVVLGMILFMLSDINVAIYNITDIIPKFSSGLFNYISNILIWILYLPSQLFLSLSGFNFNKSNYLI